MHVTAVLEGFQPAPGLLKCNGNKIDHVAKSLEWAVPLVICHLNQKFGFSKWKNQITCYLTEKHEKNFVYQKRRMD